MQSKNFNYFLKIGSSSGQLVHVKAAFCFLPFCIRLAVFIFKQAMHQINFRISQFLNLIFHEMGFFGENKLLAQISFLLKYSNTIIIFSKFRVIGWANSKITFANTDRAVVWEKALFRRSSRIQSKIGINTYISIKRFQRQCDTIY